MQRVVIKQNGNIIADVVLPKCDDDSLIELYALDNDYDHDNFIKARKSAKYKVMDLIFMEVRHYPKSIAFAHCKIVPIISALQKLNSFDECISYIMSLSDDIDHTTAKIMIVDLLSYYACYILNINPEMDIERIASSVLIDMYNTNSKELSLNTLIPEFGDLLNFSCKELQDIAIKSLYNKILMRYRDSYSNRCINCDEDIRRNCNKNTDSERNLSNYDFIVDAVAFYTENNRNYENNKGPWLVEEIIPITCLCYQKQKVKALIYYD